MNILFMPAPEWGHIAPILPIAQDLSQRGHHVRVFLPKIWRHVVKKAGIEVDLYLENDESLSLTAENYQFPIPGRILWKREWEERASPEGLPDRVFARLIEIATARDIHLIVVDYLFRRKPAGVVNRLRRHFPIAFLSTSLLYADRDLCAEKRSTTILCPAQLLPPEIRLRFPQETFAEPSILRGQEASLRKVSDNPYRPLVVCAFGTQADLHRDIKPRLGLLRDVAKLLPHINFIATDYLGLHSAAKEADDKSNLRLVPNLSQLEVLYDAAAFITHCGLGSVKEALYTGTPMLCWPLRGDQQFNSLCVTAAGVGLANEGDLNTPSRLAKTLEHLINSDEVGRRVHDFQQIFRERESNPVAALRLLEMAEKSPR
jgi:UDP:flavonoid glycosyltransferase YjiC (YdhE family)